MTTQEHISETAATTNLTRRRLLRTRKSLGAVGASILTLALLAGCQAGPLGADDGPGSDGQPVAGDDTNNSTETPQDTSAPADPTPTESEDPAAGPPDGLPADLPDVGIPFYSPSELASIMSVGGPWVIELVTDDSVNRVRDFITDRLSAAHGWADTITEVNETFIAREGTKDGYKLTIVINHERDPGRTSLFYTLDHQ